MPVVNNTGDVALSYVSPTLRFLPVVVAGKHNTSWLFHLRIRNLQSVEETMTQMHQLFESMEYRSTSAIPRGYLSNLFIKESIYKAEISMVSSAFGIICLSNTFNTRIRTHHYWDVLTKLGRCARRGSRGGDLAPKGHDYRTRVLP